MVSSEGFMLASMIIMCTYIHVVCESNPNHVFLVTVEVSGLYICIS